MRGTRGGPASLTPWHAIRAMHDERTRRGRHGEEGFTLIELLITVVILPVIVGALTLALVSVFSLQGGVSNRISDSSDAQTVAANFEQDVQSAQLLTTNSSSTSPSPCGSSSQILGLEWGVSQSGVTQNEVSYVAASGKLYRYVCRNGNTTTPVSSSVVAYDVPTTVTCPLPGKAGGECTTVTPASDATAAAAGWVATPGVSGVTMVIVEPLSGYTYSLDGVPRDWTPASGGQAGGGQPIYPLEVLGGTGTCSNSASLSLIGGSSINVGGGSGTFAVTSPCANSVQVSGGSNLNAGAVVTANPSLNSVEVTGGSTGPSGSSAETYQSSLSDPLASLAPPSNPTTALTGSCSVLVAYVSNTCSPGNYSSLPGFSGGSSIAFSSGTYVFSSAISIGNGDNVSFGSGTYWFEGGLTLGGGITATFGTGTYIFGTSSSGTNNALTVSNGVTLNGSSSGLLLYAEGGSVNFAGGAGTTLTGLSQYDNVVIWDMGASGTTNPLQLTNGSSSQSISGGIYIPNGQVVISGSSPTTMEYVVTSTINQSNGTTLNVVG